MWDDGVIRGLRVIERAVLVAERERLQQQHAASKAPVDPDTMTQPQYEAWVASQLEPAE